MTLVHSFDGHTGRGICASAAPARPRSKSKIDAIANTTRWGEWKCGFINTSSVAQVGWRMSDKADVNKLVKEEIDKYAQVYAARTQLEDAVARERIRLAVHQ
jgi:hypothetical protein